MGKIDNFTQTQAPEKSQAKISEPVVCLGVTDKPFDQRMSLMAVPIAQEEACAQQLSPEEINATKYLENYASRWSK